MEEIQRKEIKKLANVIHGIGDVRGFTFIKVDESMFVYIYEQIFDETDERICYEVFEKRVNKVFGCEKYPRSEAFGDWAYSCETWESALEYKRMLEEKARRKA